MTMKAIKYLMLGALMIGFSTQSMAQDDKATIEAAKSLIKSKPADLDKQMKDFYKKNKKNPVVLTGVSRAYYDAKDTANARVFANYAIEASAKNRAQAAGAYIVLGDIAALANDGGAAAQNYNQATYADPKNPDGYYKYALVYRKVSPQGAVDKLQELKKQVPDYPVEAISGHIYYISNEFTRAADKYKEAGLNKLEDSYITEYAMSLYFTGKNQEAYDVAKFGASKSPRNAGYNRLAFFNATELKQYDEALQYADALFNKSDSAKFSYMDYTYYGNALNGLKRSDEAIEAYKKALEMEFDNTDKKAGVIKQLAEAYKDKDDHDNAIKHHIEYMNTVSKSGANDIAGLAQLYINKAASLTNPAEQRECFEKALAEYAKIDTDPEFAAFMSARVANYMDPELKEGLAKPYYEKLVSLITAKSEKEASDAPRLKQSYWYLASYYMMNDNDAQAKEYWQKLLEIDPENENAKKALSL